MNRDEIKSAVGKLVPDKEMEQRIFQKISQKKHNRFSLKSIASIAACIVVVASLGIFSYNSINKKVNIHPNDISSKDGIYIPKIELPKKTNTKADMLGLIVYRGKVYIQSGTKVSFENAGKLLGEKLGTTKGNIDEWSKQKDYAVEFASSIGKADVYSVKGYDRNFRIMIYDVLEGGYKFADFYECLNGITVSRGEDVFSKLKMENNIESAKLEKFESWNNNIQQYKELRNLKTLNSFVGELKNTIPFSQESLMYLFDNQGDTNQKFIYVTLKDGSEIQLRLFKDGYIYYNYAHVFFKMDDKVFNTLWNELQ